MNKKMYVYAPSGAVRDKKEFFRAQKRLTQHGFDVTIDPDCLNKFQRFAGTDEQRLAAIHRAASSSADVAIIARGGYGYTRLLDRLDYTLIAKAIDHGMKFVGQSDFTAFQNAVLAKTGSITWSGPNFSSYFGVGGLSEPDKNGKRSKKIPDEITEACFLDVATGIAEGTGWRQSGKLWNASVHCHYKEEFEIKNAILWGGNLTVLTSLLGTPYFPKINDGILFIEDVGEHPYRIERMLTQLLQAGVLHKQQAILFGKFTNYKLTPADAGFNITEVIQWLGGKVAIPILNNLPFGHVETIVMLPVGAKVDLYCEKNDVLMLWSHEHSDHEH
jgi:muramoyltetrapeptide carboxypeptidase